ANNRFGGRHDGFFRRSYHSPGRKKAPVMAATKHAATNPSSISQEDASITAYSLSIAATGRRGGRSLGCLAIKMLFGRGRVGLGRMYRAVAMLGRSIKSVQA